MSRSLWASALVAQSAAVTIAMRLPIFYEAAVNPQAKAARDETYRATTEKMDAIVESFAAANVAAFSMWMNMWMRPGDASVVTRGMTAIAHAAEKPVSRRVHSNAKRLTRRTPR